MQAFYEGELTLTSSRSFIQPALFCLMQGSSDSRELNESWLQRMIQITTHPLLNRLHFWAFNLSAAKPLLHIIVRLVSESHFKTNRISPRSWSLSKTPAERFKSLLYIVWYIFSLAVVFSFAIVWFSLKHLQMRGLIFHCHIQKCWGSSVKTNSRNENFVNWKLRPWLFL